MRRQQKPSLSVAVHHHRTGAEDQRPGVVHRHLHGRPGAAAVRTERPHELGFLAVVRREGAPHGEAPDHGLPRRAIEHRIGVGELDRPLPLPVIEDGGWVLPGGPVVFGQGDQDVAHVFLAVGHGAEGDDEVLLFVALDDDRLPQSPGPGLLVHAADDSNVGDVSLMLGCRGRHGNHDQQRGGQRSRPRRPRCT